MEWEQSEGCFDEVFSAAGGPRAHYDRIVSLLGAMSDAEIARREKLHDDPVMFAIRDRNSHGIAVLALIILWMAV